MDHLKRSNYLGRRYGDQKSQQPQSDSVKNYFQDQVDTYGVVTPPSGNDSESIPGKELLPDFQYYKKHLGFDLETYEFYKQMVSRTLDFSRAYLDAEMNPADGYKPFFA